MHITAICVELAAGRHGGRAEGRNRSGWIMGMGKPDKGSILIVDDAPEVVGVYAAILAEHGYRLQAADSAVSCLAAIGASAPDLVLLDLCLGRDDGIAVLRQIKARDPRIQVVMMTGNETIQTAVAAMQLGACDYLPKPIPAATLLAVAERIFALHVTHALGIMLAPGDNPARAVVGKSPAIQAALAMASKVAAHNVNVLILGETGTGKELVARAIHALSPRRHGPFVPIDCAVLPDSLVESELFGHEKGAFTGAAERRLGKFEQAQGGTVFLDEVGNLPAHLQVKLLRVLQERTVDRLGGKGPVKVDFRLVSATNGTLEPQDGDACFRRDLLHRLNGVTIQLPPLRERGEDVHLLANHFLALFNHEHGRRVTGFAADALRRLRAHPWPGNVRELANAVKTAVVLADDDDLAQPCHLPSLDPPAPAAPMIVGRELFRPGGISLRDAKRQLTREAETYLIVKALKECAGNKRRAAELLDIDYKSLFNKLHEYGLK